jgi:hypothetical protein
LVGRMARWVTPLDDISFITDSSGSTTRRDIS